SGIRIVTIAYKTTTVLMMIYLAVAWLIHLKNDYNSKKLRSWSHHVLIAISLVWASFVYQHITETILDYAVGGGLASIPIYYLLIVIIKNPNVFVKAEKIDIPNDVILKIQKAFEIENIFLNRDLNLTQFASTQEIPAYLVTKTVNHLYGKTFPETVNYFRVNEIKNKLAKNTEEFVKIEWLAYDSGFKTTSTFYTAFKKETGMTPKAFQRQHRAQTTI
ncbi:MAG: helix-turn-helix domain-containing protein, partial [Bacteroidota bacterium]